ncbi:MAG TPA: SHOCT domain-containing protein [Terrimesophilobacter sp.]|uniref:SHOCT domain-containing protein n=1 Tax=Terrimesophilobacter sp. TaxID=2906435 RepID=UPI002F9468D6
MMWGNYGIGLWGWVFGVLVLVGIVILIAVLLRDSSSSSRQSAVADSGTRDNGAPSPKQILDERYAKGELTSEEYRERLATLGLNP